MMSLLKQLAKPADRPVIMTITGEAGVGKTSLACTFPSPVVLQFEDGLQSIPQADRPVASGVITSQETLFEWLAELYNEEHPYKTLIIDSVTAMDEVLKQAILDAETNDNKRNMASACGGFGKAYGVLANYHKSVRDWCQSLNTDKGMHIVLIAHSIVENLDLPDTDAYQRYSINLMKNKQGDCQKHWVDNVDVVAFMRLQTYLKGNPEQGKQKATTDGKRTVDCRCNPANVSKNRFNIDKLLPFTLGTNPFVDYIPSLKGGK
jgi:hypothetical protein